MADYLTLAEVKAQVLLDLGSDTTYDTLLPIYITRASRAIDRYTKRSFDLTAGAVKTFDGTGTKYLGNLPDLNAVTQLRVKVGGTLGVWTVCPATDYFLEPANRRPGHPATWLEIADLPAGAGGVYIFDTGKRTVEITGDWGWAAVPDEIKGVCLELTVRLWRQRGAGQSDSAGGDNLDVVNVPRAFSSSARMILDDLTRTVIA